MILYVESFIDLNHSQSQSYLITPGENELVSFTLTLYCYRPYTSTFIAYPRNHGEVMGILMSFPMNNYRNVNVKSATKKRKKAFNTNEMTLKMLIDVSCTISECLKLAYLNLHIKLVFIHILQMRKLYIHMYGPHIFSTTSTSADLWFTRVQTGSFLYIQKKVHHYKVQLSIKAYSILTF